MEVVYTLILAGGLLYLGLMIFSGLFDSVDFGVDSALDATGLDVILGLDGAEASGLGCGVLAAFMAGFGAVGLVSLRAGWSLLLSLLVAVAFGMILARISSAALRYVYAGQYTETKRASDLVGLTARVTLETPAGQTGEVMVESGDVTRYPVHEINGEALHRGDQVEIVEVRGNFLIVRRQSSAVSG